MYYMKLLASHVPFHMDEAKSVTDLAKERGAFAEYHHVVEECLGQYKISNH